MYIIGKFNYVIPYRPRQFLKLFYIYLHFLFTYTILRDRLKEKYNYKGSKEKSPH